MTVKTRILRAIEDLPADASFGDVVERLLFLHKVDKGLRQIADGESMSHDEARERIETWRE
jgi:predicted transcriptional regulator